METERILDALVVVKLLPTLKYININNQKSFHWIMNMAESEPLLVWCPVCDFSTICFYEEIL